MAIDVTPLLTTLAARTALVLETNNLRGGADAALVARSLQNVVTLLAMQSVPLARLAQVVVTHDGLGAACRDEVQRLAGCPVQFVRIDADAGYYDAKNIGFGATDPDRAQYIVFADADCVPEPTWLAELLSPLSGDDAPPVVVGRTSYAASMAGIALTTLDFMYFPSPLADQATRNFYANNVVFRREVFAEHSYQALAGVYRAHCQVLGLRLQAAGVPLRYAPGAHTVHRLPDTRREALKLRWMRGQDTHGLTPHLVAAYLPRSMAWLGRSGPVGPLCVLACRLVYSLRALNHQHLPPLRGFRRIGGMALIAAFSAVDMAGALCRGLGWRSVRGADAHALSYHHR